MAARIRAAVNGARGSSNWGRLERAKSRFSISMSRSCFSFLPLSRTAYCYVRGIATMKGKQHGPKSVLCFRVTHSFYTNSGISSTRDPSCLRYSVLCTCDCRGAGQAPGATLFSFACGQTERFAPGAGSAGRPAAILLAISTA